MMKASMRDIGKDFSSHRMLREYAESFYAPALKNFSSFTAKNAALAREISAYLEKLRRSWGLLRIEELASPSEEILKIGDKISIHSRVFLADLAPEEVCVELFYGPLSSDGEIEEPRRLEMQSCALEGQHTLFCAEVACDRTGRLGYTVRILPKHKSLVHPFLPGLVKWG